MYKYTCLILFFLIANAAIGQKNVLEVVKTGTVAKDKEIAVKKDRRDKYYNYQKIETALMKGGFSVASNAVVNLKDIHNAKNYVETKQSREINKFGQTNEYKSFYLVEYNIGKEPKRGPDKYSFRISLFELSTGKMLARGTCIGNEHFITKNLEQLIAEFVTKLAKD